MKIIIIGNGITGITCARHIRKQNSSATITVISKESPYFFSRTALMYIYMGHMKFEHTKPYEDSFWKKNRIDLINNKVRSLDVHNQFITLENNEILSYDKLIIASGSIPKKMDWPGVNLKGVQGLYSLQDLEEMERNTKNISSAVIVGGGLIGVEMAEMLHSRGIKVTMLIREEAYWANVLPLEEAKLIGRHLQNHGINLKFNTELKEIQSDDQQSVSRVLSSKQELIDCQFLGLAIGVQPNIDFLENSEINLDRGVLVNEFLETNIPNVYAAGDCAQIKIQNSEVTTIEQFWYTGKMQGEYLANRICGNKKAYNRGIYFNSAKFFDIEYQTYGEVVAKLPENNRSFYWEHKNGKISFRANFNTLDKSIIGFNFLGIRFRQQVAEEWISEKRKIDDIIDSLEIGFFDPEFSISHKKDIKEAFKLFNEYAR